MYHGTPNTTYLKVVEWVVVVHGRNTRHILMKFPLDFWLQDDRCCSLSLLDYLCDTVEKY
jgi:hypothetical protein